MQKVPDSLSGTKKVLVFSGGALYRTIENEDLEKAQNEAVLLTAELKAMGKTGVYYKTLQGISG